MCAGGSSRFPQERPKWSLTHPSGNMMAAESIRGLAEQFDRVVAVFSMEAVDAQRTWLPNGYQDLEREFTFAGLDVEILADPSLGRSHAADVGRALDLAEVEGPFVAKDCDNWFSLPLAELGADGEGYLAVSSLMDSSYLVDPRNKSYVQCEAVSHRAPYVVEVAERVMLSDLFCCGAYGFPSAEVYREHMRPSFTNVSQVVQAAINEKVTFRARKASGYEDWGTVEAWQRYRDTFRTLFVDIDGTLLQGGHRTFYPRWGQGQPLVRNVRHLNELVAGGRTEVILTTARPEYWRAATELELERAGVKYHRLVMGLRHCARVLVNDYHPGRAERTASAVQLPRDTEQLPEAMAR